METINGLPENHFYLEEDGVTYTMKTPEMKLKDGLITLEEYNEFIKNKRASGYKEKTDQQVIELMRNYLNENKDKLSEADKKILDSINKDIADIKKEYPKE